MSTQGISPEEMMVSPQEAHAKPQRVAHVWTDAKRQHNGTVLDSALPFYTASAAAPVMYVELLPAGTDATDHFLELVDRS